MVHLTEFNAISDIIVYTTVEWLETSPGWQANNDLYDRNEQSGSTIDQADYSVAYLQEINPDRSETSAYRLFTIDRDGSNRKVLLPKEGVNGLGLHHVAWSPVSIDSAGNYGIALVYNGNIWLIDSGTGIARQAAGDGLTNLVDWR